MQILHNKSDLREQISAWRRAGDRIALVPTMGSLHAGHLSLVELARQHADRVVATVFVNPTQFGAGEDFDEYPRTLDSDAAQLETEQVDLLYAPDEADIYPFGTEAATRVIVPGLGDEFCGAGRPGHFDGVTSVVARLFALVQPDVAVFGQKDFQQQLIIRRMVEDLGLPIDIVLAPTVREPSGLAMSSRNAYLQPAERESAAAIHRVLQETRQHLLDGSVDYAGLESAAIATLAEHVDSVEYLAIRRAADLASPGSTNEPLVILVAAHLAGVRLIDNVLVAD